MLNTYLNIHEKVVEWSGWMKHESIKPKNSSNRCGVIVYSRRFFRGVQFLRTCHGNERVGSDDDEYRGDSHHNSERDRLESSLHSHCGSRHGLFVQQHHTVRPTNVFTIDLNRREKSFEKQTI